MIPVLLIRGGGLYKGMRFKNHKYVGDPINAIKIFNDKEVDELVVLDISATLTGSEPDFALLEQLAGEAFMPMGYGGGLTSMEQIDRLFALGFEKIVINSAVATKPSLIEEASRKHGNQSVVLSIDARRKASGDYSVVTHAATKELTGISPEQLAKRGVQLGAGEIIINSVDRDGTMSGYDLSLIERVASSVIVPVIAAGGAGELDDFVAARSAGASAACAGAMFVFQGPHRAVLISYPEYWELERVFGGS